MYKIPFHFLFVSHCLFMSHSVVNTYGNVFFSFYFLASFFSLLLRMESTGKPGHIHITQETFNFLENKYVSEPGEEFEGEQLFYANIYS